MSLEKNVVATAGTMKCLRIAGATTIGTHVLAIGIHPGMVLHTGRGTRGSSGSRSRSSDGRVKVKLYHEHNDESVVEYSLSFQRLAFGAVFLYWLVSAGGGSVVATTNRLRLVTIENGLTCDVQIKYGPCEALVDHFSETRLEGGQTATMMNCVDGKNTQLVTRLCSLGKDHDGTLTMCLHHGTEEEISCRMICKDGANLEGRVVAMGMSCPLSRTTVNSKVQGTNLVMRQYNLPAQEL